MNFNFEQNVCDFLIRLNLLNCRRRNNNNYQKKKMFVCGIKEVKKIIRRKECKLVIFATNIENVQSLMDEINQIRIQCENNKIR